MCARAVLLSAQVHYDCTFRGIDAVSSRAARLLGGNRIIAEVRGEQRHSNELCGSHMHAAMQPTGYQQCAHKRCGTSRHACGTACLPPAQCAGIHAAYAPIMAQAHVDKFVQDGVHTHACTHTHESMHMHACAGTRKGQRPPEAEALLSEVGEVRKMM